LRLAREEKKLRVRGHSLRGRRLVKPVGQRRRRRSCRDVRGVSRFGIVIRLVRGDLKMDRLTVYRSVKLWAGMRGVIKANAKFIGQ
jgi:hypothetical protein